MIELGIFEIIEGSTVKQSPSLKEIAARVDEKEAKGWRLVGVTASNQILMRRDK